MPVGEHRVIRNRPRHGQRRARRVRTADLLGAISPARKVATKGGHTSFSDRAATSPQKEKTRILTVGVQRVGSSMFHSAPETRPVERGRPGPGHPNPCPPTDERRLAIGSHRASCGSEDSYGGYAKLKLASLKPQANARLEIALSLSNDTFSSDSSKRQFRECGTAGRLVCTDISSVYQPGFQYNA